MKYNNDYLHEFKQFTNIKFKEIRIIGTSLNEENLKSKFELRNLTRDEKYILKLNENIRLSEISQINKILIISELEKYNLFVYDDFEISLTP